ncbi:hypothetical protein NXS19_004763 [Fusarium pseudograminearum]|nr:hypothetical protein NXS19_004763 [Fusarium pseudograminearum]
MIDPSKSHHIVSRWKVDLANRWYSIKSETLHIPDRFCFLRSEGPPPKKVFEVESLIRFWPALSFYAISIGFAVHLGISQVWESPGYLFAHQIAYSHFFGYLAFYNHYRNSKDWGTWEYSDDATAPIHYGREIFECFWDWWEHLLLDFFFNCSFLLQCVGLIGPIYYHPSNQTAS